MGILQITSATDFSIRGRLVWGLGSYSYWYMPRLWVVIRLFAKQYAGYAAFPCLRRTIYFSRHVYHLIFLFPAGLFHSRFVRSCPVTKDRFGDA